MSSIIKYIFGNSNDYLNNYENILEYVPIITEIITKQNINENDILLNSIYNYIDKNNSLNNNKFIISLSGGVDSMVLTTILKFMYYDVVCVHINYNNREETNQEEEFLKEWCSYNGIKLYVKKIENIKRNSTKRSVYEEITKKIRFDFYKEILKKENVHQILLAHHKDDIVENIFANVCRGRNILDLAVIKENCTIENVNILRPMLQFYKNDIYDFARKYQVPYFKDTTPEWSVRGKYRNQISPLLLDTFTNNVKENLIILSNQSNEWNNIIQNIIIEPFIKTVKFNESSVEFNIENYKNYPIVFWSSIFSKLFFHYGKPCPSRKAINVFMNSIQIKNVSYISISNLCICYNKNYNITIKFK